MGKKKRKPIKQPSLSPSRSVVKKTKMINPIIVGAVSITMLLALIVTVLPGTTGPGGAGVPGGATRSIDSSTAQRIQALEASARRSPEDVGTQIELGNAYFDSAQYGKAVDAYAQVLERTPNNTNVRTDLGISYYYLGMVSKAIAEYKEALEFEPNKVQTLYNLGIAYADSSSPDIDSAVAQWQKVIDQYPGSADAKKSQEMMNKYKK